MKIDPYKHKERYINWKKKVKKGIPKINKENSDLIKQYLLDMEKGFNISSTSIKGARSYIRLNTLRSKLVFFAEKFKEKYKVDYIPNIKEEQLCDFFVKMKQGRIKRLDGKRYISVSYYVICFKAFWHWYIKINKKEGKIIEDITSDLDTKQEKPRWVYLTEEQVRKLCDNAKYEYRVLIMFLFDSGIRSPSELINLKVSDLSSDFKEIHIRDEISKTFGRRIKLMLCSDLLKEYVDQKRLNRNDFIFEIKFPSITNRYFRRLAKKIFGSNKSLAGETYSNLTMYDFRHISCCYWLPRYKSESALKYRFGWKKSDKIHYYSELLGMKDTISEEDLLIDTTKTEIEKRLIQTERKNELQSEKMIIMEKQLKEIQDLTNELHKKIGSEKSEMSLL
jgi:integrase